MLERIRNWLIRKLGGVSKDTYENVVEIANRYQHEAHRYQYEAQEFKIKQQQMNIVPLYVRLEKNSIRGRYLITPEARNC